MTTNTIAHAQLLAGYTGIADKGVIIGVARDYGCDPQRFTILKGIENDKLVAKALGALNELLETKIAAGYVEINVLVSTNIAIYARQAAIKAHTKDMTEESFVDWLYSHYYKRDSEGSVLKERLPSPEVDEETVRLFNVIKGAGKVSVNIEDVSTLLRYQISTGETNLPKVVKPVKGQKGYDLHGKNEDGSYYAIPDTFVYGYMPEIDMPVIKIGHKFYLDRWVTISGRTITTENLLDIMVNNPQYTSVIAGVSAALSVIVNDLMIYYVIKGKVAKTPENMLAWDKVNKLSEC